MTNLAGELPARMTCMCCFRIDAFEQRISKRGGIYFTCPFCALRIFVNNHVQAYGLLFWAKMLADDKLLQAARTDLERAVAQQPIVNLRKPVPSPAAPSMPFPIAGAPATIAAIKQGNNA
jgi:hypothetical protein